MRGRLEPEIGRRFDSMPDEPGIEEETALYVASAAISLKRIADALERLDPAAPLNAYGETIGTCIQGQHERGLRGIPNP